MKTNYKSCLMVSVASVELCVPTESGLARDKLCHNCANSSQFALLNTEISTKLSHNFYQSLTQLRGYKYLGS